MEQKFSAPTEKAFALLTDPQWLEARSAALGELSAKVTAKKSAGGAVERFALGQVESGCADELVYLAQYLKTHK